MFVSGQTKQTFAVTAIQLNLQTESSNVTDNLSENERDFLHSEIARTCNFERDFVNYWERDVRSFVKGADEIIDVAKATEKQLDDVFANLAKDPPYKYSANTIEHKAERWVQYKERMGDQAKDYNSWSNTYNANMTKATKANQVADEYMAAVGWGEREVSVQAGDYSRRLDIADKILKKGIEVKSYETGTVYATEAIRTELNADKYLIDNLSWRIESVFKACEPSQPLKTLLEQSGITIKLVP